MSRRILILNSFLKTNALLLRGRFLRHALQTKRCCSSKDSAGPDDLSLKKETTESKKNENIPSSTENLESKPKEQISAKEDIKGAAKNKLFSLLQELEVTPNSSSSSSLNLARAVKRPLKTERFKEELEKRKQGPYHELQTATETVAKTLSGDPKITLAELNERLGALNLAKRTAMSVESIKESEATEKQENIILDEETNGKIMSSVAEVAANVTDNATPMNSELGRRLQRLSIENKTSSTQSVDDLVKGMRVDSETKKTRRDSEIQLGRKDQPRPQMRTRIDLFQSPPLGIFKIPEESQSLDMKKTVWQMSEERTLKLLVQYAPTNAFEEMIMWTEQGKHWKFPIDNEAELFEEKDVGFHEHVFLEKHLHGFPTKGPVRHFMELVCVGLSKNPYISVERKIENIDWFRAYFKDKEEVLKSVGALGEN